MSPKIGEFELIEHIKTLFEPLVPENTEGIGDDCAIIGGGQHSTVITTDILCQDVHFKVDMGGHAIGRRAVMVNLSDIASMGATPTAIFLSIAVPQALDSDFLEQFFAGVRSCGIALLGGDTTASKSGFIVNITAVGVVASKNIKRRGDAVAGDVILVAGALGAQGASGYTTPVEAQTEQGIWLGEQSSVRAMMDISDGLAGDLPHILKASKVGAIVDMDAVPIAGNATMEQALSAGEDFVLLLTCDGSMVDDLKHRYYEKFSAPLYNIGVITEENISTIRWTRSGALVPITYGGYTHF